MKDWKEEAKDKASDEFLGKFEAVGHSTVSNFAFYRMGFDDGVKATENHYQDVSASQEYSPTIIEVALKERIKDLESNLAIATKAAEKKLLHEAAKGFEDWENSCDSYELRKSYDSEVSKRLEINKANCRHSNEEDALIASQTEAWGKMCWQAARLSYIADMRNGKALSIPNPRIEELEAQLEEANEIIAMVEDHRKMPHQHSDAQTKLYCLTERAGEYQKKFENK